MVCCANTYLLDLLKYRSCKYVFRDFQKCRLLTWQIIKAPLKPFWVTVSCKCLFRQFLRIFTTTVSENPHENKCFAHLTATAISKPQYLLLPCLQNPTPSSLGVAELFSAWYNITSQWGGDHLELPGSETKLGTGEWEVQQAPVP